MSKPHRGKSLVELPAHGRGVCPVCKHTGVKLLYETEVDGQKLKICKMCKATIENKK